MLIFGLKKSNVGMKARWRIIKQVKRNNWRATKPLESIKKHDFTHDLLRTKV